MEKNKIIAATQAWVEKVVVGLNFCPFAKKEVVNDRIRYALFQEQHSSTRLLSWLDKEITILEQQPQIETTLLILPSGFESFYEYLDALDLADQWLDDNGFRGIYQLASFHPQYCFAGEASDSVANYTNRSPFPMIHILREASMERAVESYKQPETIPENNIAKTHQLGLKSMQALLQSCIDKQRDQG